MIHLYTREGHPFRDEKTSFDDLMDYSLALARGAYLELVTGRTKISNGIMKVLDFNFEKCYLFENGNDDDLTDEIDENVNHWNFDDDYDCDDEENEDDEEDEDSDERIHLSYDSCFAVTVIRYKKIDGQLHECLTAIHKKYRQAIQITKNLVNRNEPFQTKEIDYKDVDPVLKPILEAFDIEL